MEGPRKQRQAYNDDHLGPQSAYIRRSLGDDNDDFGDDVNRTLLKDTINVGKRLWATWEFRPSSDAGVASSSCATLEDAHAEVLVRPPSSAMEPGQRTTSRSRSPRKLCQPMVSPDLCVDATGNDRVSSRGHLEDAEAVGGPQGLTQGNSWPEDVPSKGFARRGKRDNKKLRVLLQYTEYVVYIASTSHPLLGSARQRLHVIFMFFSRTQCSHGFHTTSRGNAGERLVSLTARDKINQSHSSMRWLFHDAAPSSTYACSIA